MDMETSFYEESNTPSLWGLFVNAGYLTISKEVRMDKYRIRIPNNEVQKEFMSLTAYYLNVSDTLLSNLFSALEERKQKDFIFNYENILLQMSSFHDFKDENSYHAERYAERLLILGMCAWLQNDYIIMSNRESGKGRYDIVLHAKKKFLPSFVMEFKYMKKEDFEKHPNALKNLAYEAINQIERNKYDIELTGDIIHIGLAHAGKEVEIIWREVM